MKDTVNIAIFASGSGTNAQRLAEYFKDHPQLRISLILSNKADAFVLERAKNLEIPAVVFSAKEFRETQQVLETLKMFDIDFLVLAGFLLLVPDYLLKAYPGKIINIHPALLPDYGGKGMYGHHVHEAVIASGDTSSGISIHYVNEHYDEGNIIFQALCPVLPDDTAETLAARIHELEYKFFPVIVEKVCTGLSE
ncbi:MAG: phosphoribosylglycinamide formyltransferase [Bacteroidales bacterium]